MPLHPTYMVMVPLQRLLDKGMPVTEWPTTANSDDGVTLMADHGIVYSLEKHDIYYVPFGWVGMPLAIQKGEVLIKDALHMLVQPLLSRAWAKAQISPELLKSIVAWNQKLLRELISTSDSWVSMEALFKKFVKDTGADPK